MSNISPLPKKYAAEQVLVVSYDALRNLLPDTGVWPLSESLTNLISAPSTMRRDDAELTTTVTQLVAYYVIVNGSRVLTHRRTRRQPEKRLTDIRALGLTGHMTEADLQTLKIRDLFQQGMHSGYANRELAEEVAVRISAERPIELHGCIWEPIDDFGKQHLGLIYFVPAEEDFQVLEPGLIGDARYSSVPEIKSSIDKYTPWSRLLLDSTLFAEMLPQRV